MAKNDVEKKNEEFLEGTSTALSKVDLYPFSEGREFVREVNVEEMKMLAHMDATLMLEIGKRLIFHKENVEHGEFRDDLAEIGIPKSTAHRYMTTARKLAGLPSLDAAKLTMSKAYAFAEELDDEDIKLLEEKGEIGKVKLDDIDRMTGNDLRKALRKEREKRKKAMEEKEEMEDKLHERASKGQLEHSEFTKAVTRYVIAGAAIIGYADDAREELETVLDEKGTRICDNVYQAIINQQGAILAALKPEFAEALDPSGGRSPGKRSA